MKYSKNVSELIQKAKTLKQSQRRSTLRYNSKIKETKKQISHLLRKPVEKYLEETLKDCSFEFGEDQVATERLVVVITKNGNLAQLNYTDHLILWKYITRNHKDYIRLCYDWDFAYSNLQELVNHLRDIAKLNVQTESKLHQNYEILKQIVEITGRIQSVYGDKVKVNEIVYYNDEDGEDDFTICLTTKLKDVEIFKLITDLHHNRIHLDTGRFRGVE